MLGPAHADVQIADVRDTLDTAVRGPSLYNGVDDPAFDVYVADQYAPIHALTFDASFVHEQRGSNELLRAYNDGLPTAGVRFMFQ